MKKYILFLAVSIGLNITGAYAQFSGGGAGTAQDPYKIVTAADLAMMRNFVGQDHADKHFRLMNHVDLTTFLSGSSAGWTPIGDETNAFRGYLHGAGYEIQGFWFNTSVNYAGFIGYNTGHIDSLSIKVPDDKSVIGGSRTGVLAGYSEGEITDCYVTGKVLASGENTVGGLVGEQGSGTITGCHVSGDLASGYYLGGLVGYQYYSSITNSSFNGKVSSTNASWIGGLVGYQYANCTINQSYAAGEVIMDIAKYSTSSYDVYCAGGLVGYQEGGSNTITKSYAMCNVSAKDSIEYSYYNSTYATVAVGGLVGYDNSGNSFEYNGNSISQSYSTGNISAKAVLRSTSNYFPYTDSYAGGLVGYSYDGSIANCYSTGNVSATAQSYYYTNSPVSDRQYPYAGGLVGYSSSGSMSNCYVTGQVTSNDEPPGAVIGYNNGTVSRCYYNTDIAGSINAIGGGTTGGSSMVQGLTTSGMKVQTLYMGWDFNTVWDIVEGSTYPFFQAEDGEISGKTKACNGSSAVYNFAKGKSLYYWTVTNGEILEGQGTNRITVSWDNVGAGSVSLNYGDGTASKSVEVAAIEPLDISGNRQPAAGTSETYSVEAGKSSYTWTVTGGAITAGQATHSITVLWECNAANRSISLTYGNGEGCFASSETTVTATEIHPSIFGNMNPVSNNTPITYITEANKSGYTWSVTHGVIQSGQGTASVSVLWNDVESLTVGHITVNYSDDKGCNAGAATDSTVTIRTSNDATLATLSLSAGTLSPAFNANTTSYTTSVPYSVSSISVSASPHHAGGTVAGTDEQPLNVGNNPITVTVTAKDGETQKNYTITVTREAMSADNALSALTVSEGTLIPAFNEQTTTYLVTVPSSVSGILINAATKHIGATLTGAGAKGLVAGENRFTVEVTAENGTVKTYSITVVRDQEQALSEEIAKLKQDTAALGNANRTLQDQLDTANGTISDLQTQNTALQDQLDTANGTISDLQTQNTGLQDQLDTANGTISDLQTQNTALQDQLDTANGTISDLQDDLQAADNILIDLHAEIADLQAALEDCLGTGIDTSQYTQINLYPNPAKEEITIDNDNVLTDNAIVEIYDLTGKMIRSTLLKTKTINVSNLPAGIYLVKTGVYRGKFIKE
jgi:hypothetical protein